MAAALASATTAVALLLQVSAAAAPPLSAPAPVGVLGCNTSCGGVEVPYPFGFGPARCYWPGLNLTCDTSSRHPPRLLLGDGTLRVTEISLKNSTVRVVGKAGFLVNEDDEPNITYDRWSNFTLSGQSFGDYGYLLSSSRNVLVVYGCNLVAELVGGNMISGCTTFCDWGSRGWIPFNDVDGCDGNPCCVAPVYRNSSPPIQLLIRSLYSAKQAGVATNWRFRERVLLAEEGWVSDSLETDEGRPLILQWSVTQGLSSALTDTGGGCPDDVSRKLCKSQYSDCILLDTMHYACQCREGFGGNPYLAGGCQDIDECKLPSEDNGCRSGECINTFGSFYCGCPRGSYGVRGGCIKKNSTTRDASSLHLSAPTPIGLRGCNTTCGNVQVPYPFGFGPARCYLPGFNLTCDTNPTRLLLGDGTFQVVDISLPDSTVRVIRNLNFTFFPTRYRPYEGGSFDLPDISEPYSLSPRSEFVLNGCSVQATLHLHGDDYKSNSISDSSSTMVVLPCNCSIGDAAFGAPIGEDYCSGTNGCCHVPISSFGGSTPKNVTFVFYGLDDSGGTLKLGFGNGSLLWKPIYAFLAEGSSMDHQIMNLNRDNMRSFRQMTSPLVLQWAVKQGFQAPTADNLGQACPGDVATRLCASDNTDCRQEHGGYTCQCSQGYDGNPYILGGCKDIDECKIPRIQKECFGDCINLVGSYNCQCPRGTHGNASLPNGCKPSVTGLSIGIGVGSGAGLLLLVLSAMYMIKKLKHRRSMKFKQKFFKQNRGQLLQQLVAQRADIVERMIIPLEELEKATNNFHKDRELGGGGHGTVYMGILSDQHIVAIKKSNITVKKEIDEFINEVAFLSQISHRNVVKLFGCCLETEMPLLVYEFVSNETLSSHLHVSGAVSLSWDHRLRIAIETAKAIAYLHSSIETPLIHRDIKSTNILLDTNLTAKVLDFGASRHIPTDRTGVTTKVQGTFGYLDPEYFYTGRLTEKSDVFSFGVLLVKLLTRKLPSSRSLSLDGEGHVAHFVTLLSSGNLVDVLDPQVMQEGGNQATEVAALAAKCVERIGDDRPTMRQVELTLEAIQVKASNNATAADTLVENSIRRRWPSDPEGIRSAQDVTRQYSLEEEYMLSARDPR